MRKFDTKVQLLKYKVLREVARHAWKGDLAKSIVDIPKQLVPGKEATMRCCVYKERAILSERIKVAMGGDKSNPNVIEVIDIACDECPVGGYEVTESCRGCIAAARRFALETPLPLTATRKRILTSPNALSAGAAPRSARTAR